MRIIRIIQQLLYLLTLLQLCLGDGYGYVDGGQQQILEQKLTKINRLIEGRQIQRKILKEYQYLQSLNQACNNRYQQQSSLQQLEDEQQQQQQYHDIKLQLINQNNIFGNNIHPDCTINPIIPQNYHLIKYTNIFSFQTNTQSYLLATIQIQKNNTQKHNNNNHNNNKYQYIISTYKCQIISQSPSTSSSSQQLYQYPIIDIITDRNTILNGALYVVDQMLEVRVSYQKDGFKQWNLFVKIKQHYAYSNNNGNNINHNNQNNQKQQSQSQQLQQQLQQQQYIGSMIRNKASSKQQLFIIQRSGPIMVFNQNGHIKLSIALQTNTQIIAFADHHPHPILISDTNWIYFININGYTVNIGKCVYPITTSYSSSTYNNDNKNEYQQYQQKVIDVLVNNPYSPYFTLITNYNTLIKYQIKTQTNKCQITSRKYYDYQKNNNKENNHNKNNNIKQFDGLLFKDNMILNKTQIYSNQDNNINKIVTKICNNGILVTFDGWRNSQKNGFIAMSCCYANNKTNNLNNDGNGIHNQQCLLTLHNKKQPNQNNTFQFKKTTLLLTLALLFLLWIVFYFFRSVENKFDAEQYAGEYQKKLNYGKYNGNFNQEIDAYFKKNQNLKNQKKQGKDIVNNSDDTEMNMNMKKYKQNDKNQEQQQYMMSEKEMKMINSIRNNNKKQSNRKEQQNRFNSRRNQRISNRKDKIL